MRSDRSLRCPCPAPAFDASPPSHDAVSLTASASKAPDRFVCYDALPYNETGKLLRHRVQADLQNDRQRPRLGFPALMLGVS